MVEPGFEIQRAELVTSTIGSRKIYSSFLELSKARLFLLLHGIIISCILLYQGLWLFSTSTNAYCYVYRPTQKVANPGTIIYHYMVNGEEFSETSTRNEMPLTQHSMRIRYLDFFPSVSRPDSFIGNWAGFLIGWGIFFVISSIIFFIPNETMPKNSYFYFTGKKPWIHMIVK